MLARVSHIEAYRRWINWAPRNDEDVEPTLEDLVASITTDHPTEAMLAGTAFHKAMEHAEFGAHFELAANGYTFMLRGGEVELPPIREMRAYKQYGDLEVTGQVDGIHGRSIIDHKTTKRFDAERFLAGAQWRYYLDIFEADTFQWFVFELKELGKKVYDVSGPQVLTAYRYPGLHEDCASLAADFVRFARFHLPERFMRQAA